MIKLDIIFINNTSRDCYTIELDEKLSCEQIGQKLAEEAIIRGHNLTIEKQKISIIKVDGSTVPLEAADLSSNNIKGILHSCIIRIENAYSFVEHDGIIFYFWTREQNHLKYPHVHAFKDDKTVLINLNTFEVTGEFKNTKKEKIAVEFVKEKRIYCLEGWRRLTEEGKSSSLKELEQEMNICQ